MGIFNHTPDVLFYSMSLTFVISLIAGIIAVRNYKLVKSVDLVLISISHFSYTGWMLLWGLSTFTFINIGFR